MRTKRHGKHQYGDRVIQARDSQMRKSKAVDSHDEICCIPTVALQSDPSTFVNRNAPHRWLTALTNAAMGHLRTRTALTLLGLDNIDNGQACSARRVTGTMGSLPRYFAELIKSRECANEIVAAYLHANMSMHPSLPDSR